MNLTFRQPILAAELALLSPIVSKKPVVPVLACVRIASDGGGALLSVTDLEIGLQCRCEAIVTEPGVVLANVATLTSIVRTLSPDAEITLHSSPRGVTLSALAFITKLPSVGAEDFPAFPDVGGDAMTLTLPHEALAAMLTAVRCACQPDNKTVAMQGVLFEAGPEGLRGVASDGKRLGLAEVAGVYGASSAVWPATTCDRLPLDADVTYQTSDNHLFFTAGSRTLYSRRLDGTFPAYRRIIPTAHSGTAEFDRAALLSAVSRVALVANERTFAISMEIAEGGCVLKAASVEVGESEERVACVANAALTIGFDARYVLDFLRSGQTARVAMAFKKDTDPVVWTPVGAVGVTSLYVLMPVRL